MVNTLDLDRVFGPSENSAWTHPAALMRRLRYGTSSTPTLLISHFENFMDVLLGRPVRLDLEGLQSKLVGAECRRGGYCFEHAHPVRGLCSRSASVLSRSAMPPA